MYFPQSTRVLAAEYTDGLRTTLRCIAHGKYRPRGRWHWAELPPRPLPSKNANRTAPCNGLHGAVRFATTRREFHSMQEDGSPNPTIRHPFAAGGRRKGTAAWHPVRLRKSGGAGRFCLNGAPCGRRPTATLQTSCPPTGCRTHPTVPAQGAPTGRPLS